MLIKNEYKPRMLPKVEKIKKPVTNNEPFMTCHRSPTLRFCALTDLAVLAMALSAIEDRKSVV